MSNIKSFHDLTQILGKIRCFVCRIFEQHCLEAMSEEIVGTGHLEGDIKIYHQLFLNAVEGLVLTNHKGEITDLNPRCSTMFGYSPEELIGQRIEILIPDEYRKNHHKHRDQYHLGASLQKSGF